MFKFKSLILAEVMIFLPAFGALLYVAPVHTINMVCIGVLVITGKRLIQPIVQLIR